MCGNGLAECGDDGGAGDARVGDGGEQVAGVVVDEVQDLHVLSCAEAHVGEVGLPGLVRQVGLEAGVGGLGPLLRLRGHLAVPGQDPVDGGR